jgi:DNA-binding NtrC family response regulator
MAHPPIKTKISSLEGRGTMENILIVDDQACVRKLLSEELVLEGYRVESVGDAQSVRRCLMSSQPDLVLLDLYLDGPDGFSLLVDIKRQHPDLPVLIFTAYDSFKNDPRLSQADGYLIKSPVLDELKEKIAGLLGKEAARETNATGKSPSTSFGMAVTSDYPVQDVVGSEILRCCRKSS